MNLLLILDNHQDLNIKEVAGFPGVCFFINSLKEAGFKLHFIIPNVRLPRIKFLLPFIHFIRYFLFNFIAIIQGIKLLKKKSIQLIYGLSSFSGLSTHFLGKKYNKPNVLKLLGFYSFYQTKNRLTHYLIYIGEIIALKLRFTKLFLLDDGSYAENIAKKYKLKNYNIYPQSWYIDLSQCTINSKLKEELGLSSNYVVLFVSRLVGYKGLDHTIKIMKILLEKEKNVRLIVVGEGPSRKNYEKLSKKLGIYNYVKFIGSVKYTDVHKYYLISDVLISTNNYSNLCLPVIEAMILGVPVVTQNIGETYKIIKHLETGMLLPYKDYNGTAEAIITLLNDKELRNKIINNAREFVKKILPYFRVRDKEEIELLKILIK